MVLMRHHSTENVVFRELDNLPKILNKDNYSLTKLGDLLMELLSAKEEGYLPGLAYLDTHHQTYAAIQPVGEMGFSGIKVLGGIPGLLSSVLFFFFLLLPS